MSDDWLVVSATFVFPLGRWLHQQAAGISFGRLGAKISNVSLRLNGLIDLIDDEIWMAGSTVAESWWFHLLILLVSQGLVSQFAMIHPTTDKI